MLRDIENDVIVDASVEPLTAGERSLAKGRLEALGGMGLDLKGREPIITCDRGYPSKDFVKRSQDNEIKRVTRARKRLDPRVDRVRSGGKAVKLAEGIKTRAMAFRLGNGEREALTTSLEEGEMEDAAFAGLYYKRWPIETKYNQVKQKLELESFGGRLADDIKRDFYAMMTASNMLSGALREANGKPPKEKRKKRRCECRANVSRAAGALKNRLVGTLITEDSLARKHLCRELVSEIRWRAVPIRSDREAPRKENLRKPHFYHNHKSNC
jgi:hypothetical protein